MTSAVTAWPRTADELIARQRELARLRPPSWRPGSGPLRTAGCFVCFARGGARAGTESERGWAAAVLMVGSGRVIATAVIEGSPGAPYETGLLALREGALLEAAVRSLPESPEVLVANASGRDHPRRAGMALHLGAVLDLPSVGVTDRPLCAEGGPPGEARGATSPLRSEGRVVGHWVRTRAGARAVVAHAGWRTDPEAAAVVVLKTKRRARTPEPLRRARRAAREARAAAELRDSR